MAKKKTAAGKKIKEIKKPSPKTEEKPKEEIGAAREVSESQDSDEEEQEGKEQEFAFDDFSSVERSAPVLKPSGREEGEELEGMLDMLGKKEEKRDEDFAPDFEKPKYSFSASSSEDDEAIQELRHIVLKETPRLIERTHEARELDSSRIQDSMLGNLGVEEYTVKYVPQHKEEVLEESEEVKGKKLDIKKYRKER